MSENNPLHRLFLLAILTLAVALPAAATDVTSIRWQGENLLIRFSDSLAYRVDLAESDTSQVIIRLSGARLPAGATLGTELRGASGRQAILTQSTPQELRLTIRSSDRMGYGTIWRPYSKTLVVHTFRWRQLGYGEEQYFKALLAFEEKLDAQGIELLRIAHATGDRRAASALGVYYARRGDFPLAAQYLKSPVDADDFAALAEVDRKNGDSAKAAAHQHSFEQLLAEAAPPSATPTETPSGTPETSPSSPQSGNTPTSMQQWLSRENWPFVAGGAALILLLIYVIFRGLRRTDTAPEPISVTREFPEPVVVAPVEVKPAAVEPLAVEPVAVAPLEVEPVAVAPTAADPPVAVAPVAVAPVEVEAPAVEPVAVAPVEVEPVAVASTAVEPTAVEPVAVEPVAAEPTPRTSTLSTQAAELRRRIEAMRAEAPTSEPIDVPAVSDESILSEARRLRLSRDSVELRKRLERTGSGRLS